MTQVQAAAASRRGDAGRAPHDFYPTPEPVTRALLPFIAAWPRDVWEPACGQNHIVNVLAEAGFTGSATDIQTGHDFLTGEPLRHPAIITNPPFRLAEEFIAHAIALETPYIAMLTQATFWHAQSRESLWRARQPSSILALTWRPDFTGSKRPYFNVIWSLWEPGGSTTNYIRVSKGEE